MGPGLRKKIERLVVNFKLFIFKVYGAVICRVPCRGPLIEVVGIVMGSISMFLHTGQWKMIGQFSHRVGRNQRRWLFIVKYFIQKGKDLAWEVSGYEGPLDPAEYASIEGKELLDESLRAGRGAILLGAHYGPSLYLHTLHCGSIDAKVLVAPGRVEYWDRFATLGAKWLQRRMFAFLGSKSLVAGREEKALVSHLRAGGAAFMDIDNPGPRAEGRTVRFLGIDISPHYFPFELALRYRSPVFFCLFEKDSRKPYRFRIVPCGSFSSALEGFRKYAAFLEERVRSCPFMWSFVPHFSAIFGETGQAISRTP